MFQAALVRDDQRIGLVPTTDLLHLAVVFTSKTLTDSIAKDLNSLLRAVISHAD
jgi:hypothetical protein